jgi:hypothetical protein
MAHLRSKITVRIKRSALGLGTPPTDLETVALIVRGSALGRRYHFQPPRWPDRIRKKTYGAWCRTLM